MSFNVAFNGKSQNDNKCINRAPGSERRSRTTNNSFAMPISSNLICNAPRTRNNNGELNLAPGSNRPYAMQRSPNDSSPNTSERLSHNSEPSFPTPRYERLVYTDLAPGSNRPSNNAFFGPHNFDMGCLHADVLNHLSSSFINKKNRMALNPNESKACDTYNDGEFPLSKCQDYNNSFYDRCVDHQRLRITCDHRIIKFSKDVRNVPHSLCVGSTQAGSMTRHLTTFENYKSYQQVATQMMYAVNHEARKTREKLINDLTRARSSVCSHIEKYSALEADVHLNVSNVRQEIQNYFQLNIEYLERRERELLMYLEEQKNIQLKVLTVKIQDFNEYNLKITQLNDALTSIQYSNNTEEIKKVTESVRKEIRSLNYKMNGITPFNPSVISFEKTDIRMQHNVASLGYLRNKMIDINNRVVMQDLCREGRAILGAPYMIRLLPPSMPAIIGQGELCRPWGACCDQNGTIYVGDRSNNRIAIFESSGKFIGGIGQHGKGPLEFERPSGVAIDLLGRLIVADKDNHRIQILTTNGELINIIGGPKDSSKDGEFNYPWDVAVNMKGDFVVTDSRNSRIQLFDLYGNFKGKFSFHGIFPVKKPKGDPSPRGVCFTPNGDILVTDFHNVGVVAISHDLKKYRVLQFEKPFVRPQGIVCDDLGNIVVADSRTNLITAFRPTGQHVFSTEADMANANGLCITPEGRIIAVDLGKSRLTKF